MSVRVFSLCAGGGGWTSDLPAGMQADGGIEIDPAISAVYDANHAVPVICADVCG